MHGLEKVLNTHRSSDSIREAFVEPEPQWMSGRTAATGLGCSRRRVKRKKTCQYTLTLHCLCTTVYLEIFTVIVLCKSV